MAVPRNRCKGEARSRLHGKGLTENDIRAIRAWRAPLREIGAAYGISAVMVHFIKKRKKWAHVSDAPAAAEAA